jgi:hypothetical protein
MLHENIRTLVNLIGFILVASSSCPRRCGSRRRNAAADLAAIAAPLQALPLRRGFGT